MCKRIRFEFVQSSISVCAKLGVRSGSNHCRRYCAKLWFVQSRLPDKSWSSYPKHRFDRRFKPGAQGETPRAFCVTFCTPQKVTSRLPFGSFPLHGKHAPVGAARFACFCRRAEILGASGRRPLPVHAKRVCRLLLKHSQAAKPPFGRSLSGTFHLLLKKQDKTRGVGRRPLPVHAKRVQMHHASRV